MPVLLTLIEILFLPIVPQGFTFQDNHVYYESEIITNKNCQDYATINVSQNDQTSYRIVSLCGDDWLVFRLDGSNQPLSLFASEAQSTYIALRTSISLWLVNLHDTQKLLYLTSKGISEIPDFRTLSGGLLLQTKGNWFFTAQQSKSNSTIIRLDPLFNSDTERLKYWDALTSGGYLTDDNLLVLTFYLAGEKHFALYDTSLNIWRLRPPGLLYPDEQDALNENKNVIFRLALPVGDVRLYYDIFIGSEKVGRTRFHSEGESVFFATTVKPGKYLLKLEKYISRTHTKSTGFTREKNLKQLSPLSVNIPKDRAVLIYIRPGYPNENKPLVLDYSYLPTPH